MSTRYARLGVRTSPTGATAKDRARSSSCLACAATSKQAGTSPEFIDTDGYEEGLIGWGAANCLAAVPGGGGPVPLRITGVFQLNDGHWRAV